MRIGNTTIFIKMFNCDNCLLFHKNVFLRLKNAFILRYIKAIKYFM